jgi:hypothetical protein
MQLTRQVGEHLVAAELGRRGHVATPFAGNVPMFDLLAASEAGRAVPIQVKAVNGKTNKRPSWQFNVTTFLDIDMEEDGQVVRGKKTLPQPELLCVFVSLKAAGQDEFYIFEWQRLQEHFFERYKGRRKPKNIQSLHCAIWADELEALSEGWDLVTRVLGPPRLQGL